MDYETIAKGRRRNWDALKPEEIRQREEEEARERKRAEREAAGKHGGFFAVRQRLLDTAAHADRVRYQLALRQGAFLVGGAILFILVWIGIEQLAATRHRQDTIRKTSNYEQILARGQVVDDLSEPVAAFHSWRSAWMKSDIPRVAEMMSSGALKRTGGRGRDAVRQDLLLLHNRGALENQREVVETFAFAEAANVPRAPWSDGELAVFLGHPIEKKNEPLRRYTAAFSWDATARKWRFADVRESQYFSIKWDSESMIKPLAVGPRAIKYDEDGNMISLVDEWDEE